MKWDKFYNLKNKKKTNRATFVPNLESIYK